MTGGVFPFILGWGPKGVSEYRRVVLGFAVLIDFDRFDVFVQKPDFGGGVLA